MCVRVLLQVATLWGTKMMEGGAIRIGIAVLATGLMCGCSNADLGLTTQSLSPEKTAAKTDPACVALTNEINTIKGDGTIERLEKAADGKTVKVSVKRSALQKQAELNKAYAEFQTRCAPASTTTAQAKPAASVGATTASAQPSAGTSQQ
jgi:hypothetical protein